MFDKYIVAPLITAYNLQKMDPDGFGPAIETKDYNSNM